jgi:hypothetical protein
MLEVIEGVVARHTRTFPGATGAVGLVARALIINPATR